MLNSHLFANSFHFSIKRRKSILSNRLLSIVFSLLLCKLCLLPLSTLFTSPCKLCLPSLSTLFTPCKYSTFISNVLYLQNFTLLIKISFFSSKFFLIKLSIFFIIPCLVELHQSAKYL